MTRRRRIGKILGWTSLVVLAVLVGGGYVAFSYATDNETLRAAIRDAAPRLLPGCLLDVVRVRVRPVAGEITLEGINLRQVEGGKLKYVGTSPWIRISYDAWASLDGRFDLKEVVVAQPTLRLRRRVDGTWNLQGLLADPWPLPKSESSPPVRVEHGTIELVDEADGPEAKAAVVLRDVAVKVSSGDLHGSPIRFEAKAAGDLCDGLTIAGTFDRASGRVVLAGGLDRLALNETLAARLPAAARPGFAQAGVTGGEADLVVRSLVVETKRPGTPPRYDATARLRSVDWKCEKLPFPIHDLSATIGLRDGVATIERSEGRDGPTVVRASGTIDVAAPESATFHLGLEVDGLAVDERTRAWSLLTFKKAAVDYWENFRTSGRVDLVAELTKATPAGPIGWGVAVGCRDAAIEYKEFKYPLEHVTGEVVVRPDRVTLDVRTVVGGRPLSARGTIEKPGPNSVVDLDFAAESLPVDGKLLAAMPPDVRKVVDSFKPAGTVRGKAHLHRSPPINPGDDRKGIIAIDAALDINKGSEITWDGLKYPVRDLTGHLELHPTSWIFREICGTHGQATITGEGRVDRVGKDKYQVGLHVHADNLLFESQLRDALQPAWQKTWDTLNPTGASDVDVAIKVEPGGRDHYHLDIIPRPQTNLRLKIEAIGQDGPEGPRRIEMPMEEVRGHFVFDDGTVRMEKGAFLFHSSPVTFASGEVHVADSGRFDLKATDLEVDEFRMDQSLRKLMPPLMAQFALRLDDGKMFRLRGNLALGWSGKAGESATCGWDEATVVFLDNTVQAGIPLHNMQGQVDSLRGSFDGQDLAVIGRIDMASVFVAGMQVTQLESPIQLSRGKLSLTSIRGTLMKGEVTGALEVDLESTPKFAAKLAIAGASLEEFARDLPGKQELRGTVSGQITLGGLGQDLHTLQGSGDAHVVQADLGKLPLALRVVSLLNLAPNAKTAFDSADVYFTVRNGKTTLNPIFLRGYALSLQGRGTMDPQGELDLRLNPVYGRDGVHVPGASDLLREAQGQIFGIRVLGTVASPEIKKEFFRPVGELLKPDDQKPPRDLEARRPGPFRRLIPR